jgi:protein-L-isoaspartate O-methyltransferase
MVLPLGDDFAQQLVVVTRAPDGTTTEQILFEVRFGPMTGEIRRAH